MNGAANVKTRSIPFAIVFSILTFGIYMLYWLYKLAKEISIVTGRDDDVSPGLVLVFTIITFGIYGVYWAYKQGMKFKEYSHDHDRTDADDCPTLYLVLFIANYLVGFTTLVGYAIMQDRMNNIIRDERGEASSFNTVYRYAQPDEVNIVAREVKEYDDVTIDDEDEE